MSTPAIAASALSAAYGDTRALDGLDTEATVLGVSRLAVEEEEAVDDTPRPRIHRRATCRVEPPLLDRLARAVASLRQRADEKHWEPDWNEYQEHQALAEQAVQAGDLSTAFREFCRAMLPLTRALHKQRHKEEVFQPVWDKEIES